MSSDECFMEVGDSVVDPENLNLDESGGVLVTRKFSKGAENIAATSRALSRGTSVSSTSGSCFCVILWSTAVFPSTPKPLASSSEAVVVNSFSS